MWFPAGADGGATHSRPAPDRCEDTMTTRCPECESELELDGYDLDVGETLNCPECSVELRVTAVAPVDVAPVEEED
jgi:alpha-aminoadipate carrier protein LysW